MRSSKMWRYYSSLVERKAKRIRRTKRQLMAVGVGCLVLGLILGNIFRINRRQNNVHSISLLLFLYLKIKFPDIVKMLLYRQSQTVHTIAFFFSYVTLRTRSMNVTFAVNSAQAPSRHPEGSA